MSDFFLYTISLIVTLGVLVTFHEWGHYYAARKLGVKVLRFSVGFGSPIWKRVAKNGVEFVVAAIPLGGYVKMLDEYEGDVAEEEKSKAFNQQPIWKRNIIVAAGPFANFVLALVVFWLMFMLGILEPKPILSSPTKDSIAEKAGLQANHEIVKIDGEDVSGWKGVTWALVERLGEQGQIVVETQSTETGVFTTHTLNIDSWQVDDRRPDVLGSLGIIPKFDRDAIIGQFSEKSPAKEAGLKAGDKIVALNGEKINLFDELAEFMQKLDSADPIQVSVMRDSNILNFSVTPISTDSGYLLGIWAANLPVEVHKAGVFEAFQLAMDETWEVISLTVTMLKKLILGEVSTKSLGGPISIAEGAGSSVRGGLVYFLSFLGMISVNLGLINLLPVPMLDGGHLLFNTIERLKGKPLSDRALDFGRSIGLVMVLGLMAIAIFNDIARL
ncbi:RIP metalloprotease RseP [Pleionea sediminis]|uniref:RIP metalloprotease RseP n=1 Tax=Pleionea sediminis TaxID=2569479 RepID=UPI001184A721|nr:RIP metalloprotease RseP [Pleionea sediminis]